MNCQTGETFAREETEAADKEHVVDALGRATNSMRAKLGESLSTIQGENRAYQHAVTTSSLEALQAFYMGDEEWTQDGGLVKRPSLCTATPPNSTRTLRLALAVLGTRYGVVGDGAQAKEAMEKAYALKDRVSERERLFIEEEYYNQQGDGKKVRDIEELLARKYPRDPMFHANLGGLYVNAGEPEKALPEAQAAIQNGPKIIQGYGVAAAALLDLNRLDDARAMLQKAMSKGLDGTLLHWNLLKIGYAQGDRQAQERETEWLVSHEAEPIVLIEQGNNAAALGHSNQAKELFRKGANLPGMPYRQQFLTTAATADALFGKCPPHDPKAPPIAVALCGAAAVKKFTEQQFASGSVPITGPDAYVRGLALLAQGQASDAASVFSLMVDRKGANWGPEYPAAQVGLARAAKMMGDPARAKKTYQQFFAFWKDADPDVPLLLEARKEYAALK